MGKATASFWESVEDHKSLRLRSYSKISAMALPMV
jgi:hypothetical protein